ncbi:MAG: Ldh family oxidoreductase [Planctomycetaceae bacterium]|nr:MAG: Ldh family oxidoreductase [Planctomycetaceae bacterium]
MVVTYTPLALREFVQNLFLAANASPAQAERVAESLVESNLRGHDSHGVVLARWYLSQILSGELVPCAPFEILHDLPGALVCDAALGFGQVQCHEFVERCCAKAKTAGAVCGTLTRCGHIGRLGEWVEQAARKGLAALIAVNDNGAIYTVAPPGGIDRRLSTNPIGIGIPTAGDPLVLDMSTSAVANGKLKIARLAQREVPLGWIQDAEGNPTTDPQVMLADPPGALLPFGGDQAYKGFGLGLTFDILAAGLSGGFCPPAEPGTKEWNNVLLVVWDADRFAGRLHFLREAEKLMAFVRSSTCKPGVDRIQLPGDRSLETRRVRLEQGIPLSDEYMQPLWEIADKLGVARPAGA